MLPTSAPLRTNTSACQYSTNHRVYWRDGYFANRAASRLHSRGVEFGAKAADFG